MLGSCRAWARSSRGRKSCSHRRWGSRTSKEKRRGGSEKECSRRYVYEFLRIPSGAWKTTKGQGKTLVYSHFFFQKIPCERAFSEQVYKAQRISCQQAFSNNKTIPRKSFHEKRFSILYSVNPLCSQLVAPKQNRENSDIGQVMRTWSSKDHY